MNLFGLLINIGSWFEATFLPEKDAELDTLDSQKLFISSMTKRLPKCFYVAISDGSGIVSSKVISLVADKMILKLCRG